jgi:hypothetical protein
MRSGMGWPFTRAATSGRGFGSGVVRSISGGAPGSEARPAAGDAGCAAAVTGGSFFPARSPEHAAAAIASSAGNQTLRARPKSTSRNESGGDRPPLAKQ